MKGSVRCSNRLTLWLGEECHRHTGRTCIRSVVRNSSGVVVGGGRISDTASLSLVECRNGIPGIS